MEVRRTIHKAARVLKGRSAGLLRHSLVPRGAPHRFGVKVGDAVLAFAATFVTQPIYFQALSYELGAGKLLPRDNDAIAKRASPTGSYAKRAHLPVFSSSSASCGAGLQAPGSRLKAMGKQANASLALIP